MKKILFVLPSLAAGGAERVMSFVAQNLNKTKYEVTLLIIGFKTDSVYEIKGIKTVYLSKRRLLESMPSIFVQIKTTEAEIVVSSISHLNIFMGFLSSFYRKVTFIGREASVISTMNIYSKNNSRLYLKLIKIFYHKLSKIICLSEDMLNDFVQNFEIEKSKLVLINNPITSNIDRPHYVKSNEIIQFVTVGRMSEEKGYDRILKGLSHVKSYNFHYTIIGNGYLKEDLLN